MHVYIYRHSYPVTEGAGQDEWAGADGHYCHVYHRPYCIYVTQESIGNAGAADPSFTGFSCRRPLVLTPLMSECFREMYHFHQISMKFYRFWGLECSSRHLVVTNDTDESDMGLLTYETLINSLSRSEIEGPGKTLVTNAPCRLVCDSVYRHCFRRIFHCLPHYNLPDARPSRLSYT